MHPRTCRRSEVQAGHGGVSVCGRGVLGRKEGERKGDGLFGTYVSCVHRTKRLRRHSGRKGASHLRWGYAGRGMGCTRQKGLKA